MKINKRLLRVASYVDDNSYLIDVGCDHALLCIYLVKNKNNIKCIASDINEGPLKQASKNILEFDCQNYIKIKQGNGLDTIESDVDTIIISGMGATTIIDIMEKCRDYSNIKKVILSPNNDFYLIREKITKIGFVIDKEEIVLDNGKFYSILVFSKGNKKYNKRELMHGYNIINNEDLISYYKYLIDVYEKRINSLPKKYIKDRLKLQKEINVLNKFLDKINIK